MRLPDKFTLLRIISAPLFFVVYFLPYRVQNDFFGALSVVILFLLLAFAEFTDFLDGYFARKLQQVSDFGKIFDPFADIFLNMTVFLCFTISRRLSPSVLILLAYREFIMLFLRLCAMQRGVTIAARFGGKLKTCFFVATCFVTLTLEGAERLHAALWRYEFWVQVNFWLFVACLITSYGSLLEYVIHFKIIFEKKLR
ncbi:MAG: CDP-diacylglycerol--glycerol-3-phosphate 3-phosphatidyltransferase [Treponemataceae bacterium]|nr:MAG: CDP-diacylglycerol--glycerol-3-phosphate 3-phosphatidyltransferase [Treponemataceae bacterium]